MLDTRSPNNRRVMLILSESRDRGSKEKLSDAIELAQRAGVVVYPATYSVQGFYVFVEVRPTSPSMPGGDDNVDILGGAIWNWRGSAKPMWPMRWRARPAAGICRSLHSSRWRT